MRAHELPEKPRLTRMALALKRSTELREELTPEWQLRSLMELKSLAKRLWSSRAPPRALAEVPADGMRP